MWITRVFLRFRRLGCFQFLFQLGNFPSSQMAIFFKIGIYFTPELLSGIALNSSG